ncbi:hypothetical protein JDV02_007411 [Purpureocillium takamizusanense]|uniref:N-acetyltransferase domain-containing protein n=1 Tax=Purpureocillium takamizusanense TaxID=2060973 RepID=A0A9Q8QMG1_9HYPO|nr:uncharacterized protein JDV02_007411 [Purpureocillium takamizusanense]UNI21419.1 hypothetical protein JDV02_007411 [Purpureocillium takamizusanense]
MTQHGNSSGPYRILPLVVVTPNHGSHSDSCKTAAAKQHRQNPPLPRDEKEHQQQEAHHCYSYQVRGGRDRRRLVSSLVALHVACIQLDGALMRFHPPFGAAQRHRMRLFWEERIAQATVGRRVVLLALPAAAAAAAPGVGGVGGGGVATGDADDIIDDDDDDNDDDINDDVTDLPIAGVVELATPDADTGPFRADVEMLMVSPRHRRAGLGGRLMAAVEDAARERGRTLLQLSTTVGSVAEERLYPALGYTKVRRPFHILLTLMTSLHSLTHSYYYYSIHDNHHTPLFPFPKDATIHNPPP